MVSERLARHSERRSRALIEAGWDLVVIDEARHVAGSSEDVARHQLGKQLAVSSPRMLLLSATHIRESRKRSPGCSDCSTKGSLTVVRSTAKPSLRWSSNREASRNRRRRATVVPARTTELLTIAYGSRNVERRLYEAVTDYVRHGYARAKAERRPAVGFLVLLMQRLVSSSTEAILTALERRLTMTTEESSFGCSPKGLPIGET